MTDDWWLTDDCRINDGWLSDDWPITHQLWPALFFCLQVLSLARPWAFLDPAPLAAAAAFLARSQLGDGSFPPLGTVIHSELLGGVGRGGGGRALTAFATVALLEAGAGLAPQDAVARALGYLSGGAPAAAAGSEGNYAAVLSAYALARAHAVLPAGATGRPALAAVGAALEDLRSRATEVGGQMYWQTSASASDVTPPVAAVGAAARVAVICEGCGVSAASPPADVEATGYALLTLLQHAESAAGEGDAAAARAASSDAASVARWLLQQRSSLGGFRSTQDTCVGLQALATYAAVVRGNIGSLQLTATAPGVSSPRFTVDASTFDVTQTWAVPSTFSGPLTVTAAGSGSALVSLAVEYHVPSQEAPPAFSLNASWAAVSSGSTDALVTVVVGPPPEGAGAAAADSQAGGGATGGRRLHASAPAPLLPACVWLKWDSFRGIYPTLPHWTSSWRPAPSSAASGTHRAAPWSFTSTPPRPPRRCASPSSRSASLR